MRYDPPPGKSGLFCSIDRASLDLAGWSAFDELDGRLDAPEALPMGGMSLAGPFGGPWVWRDDPRRVNIAEHLRLR